jgi:hypothetical protein
MEVVRTTEISEEDGRVIAVVLDDVSGMAYLRVTGPERLKTQQIGLTDESLRVLVESLGGVLPPEPTDFTPAVVSFEGGQWRTKGHTHDTEAERMACNEQRHMPTGFITTGGDSDA